METPQLLLVSGSATRKRILDDAGIAYTATSHTVDEESFDSAIPDVRQRCEAIARAKAQSYDIPAGIGDRWIVLAADTTTLDRHDAWYAKPGTYEAAVNMLTALQGWITVYTVAVLVWYERIGSEVHARKTVVIPSESRVFLHMSSEDIQRYLNLCPEAIHASGGLMIDGHGARYIRRIEGSVTGIMGLPLFEVCQALSQEI